MTTASGNGNGYGAAKGGRQKRGSQQVLQQHLLLSDPRPWRGTQWFANVAASATATHLADFKRIVYYANGQTPSAPSTIGDIRWRWWPTPFTNAGSDFTTSPDRLAARSKDQALRTRLRRYRMMYLTRATSATSVLDVTHMAFDDRRDPDLARQASRRRWPSPFNVMSVLLLEAESVATI